MTRYSNPHFDPAVEVKEDRNGIACPHCEWRFLRAAARETHLALHHPAAERGTEEIIA